MKGILRKTGKFLALLMVAALALVIATGCSGGDGRDPAAHVGDTPRTITIAAWYNHSLHGAAPVERPDPDEAADYEMAMMQYNNMREVEERFNVRIEHAQLAGGDYTTFIELFLAQQMAGSPVGDIVLLGGHSTLVAMQGGHLTDLGALNFNGSDLHGSRTYISATFEQGDSIWQVNTNTGGDIWGALTLGVNMDLVNRLGLEDPIALYNAGDWNWDSFLRIMRTAAAQGYFGISGVINDIGPALVAANDGIMVTADFNYGFDHPNTMEALEFFNTIVDERLWQYDRYGAEPLPEDDWWRSMTCFADGQSVFFAWLLWVPDMIGGTDINFSVLPVPPGPSNTSGNSWAGGIPQAVVVPAGVENPELVLRVMEALMAWSGEDTWMITEAAMNNVRGVVLTEECAERWVYIAANRRGSDPGFDVSLYRYIFSPFLDDIFNGVRTIAEAVEYQRGPRQEMLDNMFR